jgi:hypothetical protein
LPGYRVIPCRLGYENAPAVVRTQATPNSWLPKSSRG